MKHPRGATSNLFTFKGLELRTTMIDGEPWFVGADAVAILGLDNSGNAYKRLADDEKSNIRRTDVGMLPGRPLVAVSEPGLYKLIQRSNKPEATVFARCLKSTHG